MSSSDSSQSIPFRCKKPLQPNRKLEIASQSPNKLASKTPEKQPSMLPRRTRNSRKALSLKEIRIAAQTRPQQPPTDHIESAGKQILASPCNKSPAKSACVSTMLPTTHRQLGEFYDSLDRVIALLKLKGSLPTFNKISPIIERLTDRRFSYSHLAQLKFILPEAIEIKKVLTFDEKTGCVKPDLQVTINADAVECDGKLKSDNKSVNLGNIFRARLMKFLKDHPEGDEIPEETMPEPFNHSKSNLHLNLIKNPTSLTSNDSSTEVSVEPQLTSSAICQSYKLLNLIKNPSMSTIMGTSASASDSQQPVGASRFSYRRLFSQKFVNSDAEKKKAEKKSPVVSNEPSAIPLLEPYLDKISSTEKTSSAAAVSPIRLSAKTNGGKCLVHCASPTHLAPSYPPATPVKEIEPMETKEGSPTKVATLQSTPAKIVCTPSRLMTTTPSLHPPKRCYMTPETVSASSPNKLTRRAPRSRSLKFDTPMKNETVDHDISDMEGKIVDDDILDILPENLLQSLREKERKAKEERDPAISQAKWRRQMIACLPKLFNMIHFLFQSIKRSVITKEELIHKLISNQLHITDRREVEDQMNLLLELVPEWISEKLSCGGDLLVCINKMSCPESIRARLEEAK